MDSRACAVAATLSLSNLQSGDAGNYTVVVSNPAGSVTSAAAELVVVLPPPIVGVSWSGGVLANGQATAVGFGATPADLVFTVTNTGTMAMTIGSVSG